MRSQLSLAGSWQFQLDPEGLVRADQLTPNRSIPVPMSWQAVFPDLESYSGYGWYVREFALADDWLTGEVLLKFGAVDYWCEVYINGQLIGEHEGGYTAFSFPIRQYVQAGNNWIAVRVYDAAHEGIVVPRWYENHSDTQPFNPDSIPHGKQSWYFESSGIWQDVTLTAVPSTYIDQVRVTPNLAEDCVAVRVVLGGAIPAEGSVRVGIGASASTVNLIEGQADYDLLVNVPQPTWWTPDSPFLYTAEISLENGDRTRVRFGFRELATRDGQLILNGQPLYLLAALDQDMYPNTIYTVPSEAFLRDEFQKAKQLGLNCLRCHIKPPDPLYLDLADELGLLVWAEIPSWRTHFVRTTLQDSRFNVTEDIRARARQTLAEMIARDYNHPSLVIWSIVNEDWGTAVTLSPGDRAWLIEMVDYCQQLDPTRLVVDNSACLTNVHVKSDLDDYHIYTNIPDQAAFFEQFIAAFSRRATWSYSSHRDAQRTGGEALILSEFGNWGLPSVNALREDSGSQPEWFKLGPWWSGEDGIPGWPKGVLDRFNRLGLKAIWGDYEAFAESSQWHQYEAMKYEIEVMRRQPLLSGYVITELSDIYWESNGLMDFNRGKKVYHDLFGQINAPDVLIPRLPRRAVWDDETLPMQVFGSHYSAADWSEAQLTLSLNGHLIEQIVPPLARGSVADWGIHDLRFDEIAHTAIQRVEMSLGDGLAVNHADLLVLPAAYRQATYGGQIVVDGSSDPLLGIANSGQALASSLQALGYAVGDSGDLIISEQPTDQALAWVRAGGKMLYLSGGVGPFFWWQGRGGVYGGSWITAFSWLRPDIFKRLNVTNPLGLPYASVMPQGVLINLPVEDRAVQGDFLAGQITGWIGHPAVHTVQFRYGKGIVLMTTHSLSTAISRPTPDPVGVAMLHDLIDHLASDACQPTLTANL